VREFTQAEIEHFCNPNDKARGRGPGLGTHMSAAVCMARGAHRCQSGRPACLRPGIAAPDSVTHVSQIESPQTKDLAL